MKDPVTVIFRRRVRAGREAEFETWIHAVSLAAQAFPGHRSTDVIRPAPGARRDYAIIFRFDRLDQAVAWEESPERARWVERARPLCEGETVIERVSGLEFWFTPPPGAVPAPRWKMAVVTFLALWPLNTLANTLLSPYYADWSYLLRGLVTVGLLVPLMTYVVMPWMTRWFAGWLYPK
jgi:antibiotic biosynthesis monooxygenase (ABM) superfamily enzyme